jgi:hypothetical protein
LQMLRPLSIKCSWNRRMSSGVAVPGERFKKAAKRLQLWMWLLRERFPSLRAFMSSKGSWAHPPAVLTSAAATPLLDNF